MFVTRIEDQYSNGFDAVDWPRVLRVALVVVLSASLNALALAGAERAYAPYSVSNGTEQVGVGSSGATR